MEANMEFKNIDPAYQLPSPQVEVAEQPDDQPKQLQREDGKARASATSDPDLLSGAGQQTPKPPRGFEKPIIPTQTSAKNPFYNPKAFRFNPGPVHVVLNKKKCVQEGYASEKAAVGQRTEDFQPTELVKSAEELSTELPFMRRSQINHPRFTRPHFDFTQGSVRVEESAGVPQAGHIWLYHTQPGAFQKVGVSQAGHPQPDYTQPGAFQQIDVPQAVYTQPTAFQQTNGAQVDHTQPPCHQRKGLPQAGQAVVAVYTEPIMKQEQNFPQAGFITQPPVRQDDDFFNDGYNAIPTSGQRTGFSQIHYMEPSIDHTNGLARAGYRWPDFEHMHMQDASVDPDAGSCNVRSTQVGADQHEFTQTVYSHSSVTPPGIGQQTGSFPAAYLQPAFEHEASATQQADAAKTDYTHPQTGTGHMQAAQHTGFNHHHTPLPVPNRGHIKRIKFNEDPQQNTFVQQYENVLQHQANMHAQPSYLDHYPVFLQQQQAYQQQQQAYPQQQQPPFQQHQSFGQHQPQQQALVHQAQPLQAPPLTDFQSSTYSQFQDPNNKTVFVGGLDDLVDEKELESLFCSFGPISYVKVPPGRGCGFVTFEHRAHAETAIHGMTGFRVRHKMIRPSWGRSKAKAHRQAF